MHDDYWRWRAIPRTHDEVCWLSSNDELAAMSLKGDRVAWLELLARKIDAAWAEQNKEKQA
jgi:hypothetical protein